MSRQSKALSRYLSHVAAAAALAVAAPSLADIAVPGQPYHPPRRPMPEPQEPVKPLEARPVATAVPLLASDYTPASLAAACDAAEKVALGKLDAIGKLTAETATFSNTFGAYEQTMADYADAVGRLAFMKDIHTNPEVRKAGAECEERGGKFTVQVGARKDLFVAMKAYLGGKGKTEKRDAVDGKLEEVAMRDFRRNGLDLPDAKREKLVQIRSKLAELGTKFSSNLGANTDSIEATQAELVGLPDSYVARLKKSKDGKKFVVTTKYPDYFPLMENAKDEGVRKRMYFAFNGREARTNMPLLAQAIALRDEAAKLLGYKNHADFITEDRMAKSSATVADFLSKLQAELKPRRDADMAKMQQIKAEETKNPKAVVEDWDWLYALNQIKKRDFTIDDEAVRAYFPSDKVMAGMFQVYSTLLGVTFNEVPGVATWSPTVKLFEVHDTASKKLLAYFYTDLYPREGKYGHAASFPIGVARALPNGGYQVPLSALVCNFNAPENGKPAFWAISEVDTLFHEFGHIMHASLTTARYTSLSGTNVATDFVEAPSQMLENWVFRSEVLKLVSQDPKDPTKTLPEDLVTRIVGARKFDAGIKYTRQVFLASFDQALHTRGAKVDPDAVDHELRAKINGFPVNKDEHFAATFGHLMGGYDAGYYGYLWSEVFAADMFTRFEKEGVLSPAVGKQYRDIILAKGREEDPEQLLREFLGRDPNQDAFLRMAGLK